MGIFDRFPYSSTHEMNLDFMLGKATEIAESLQEIDTHKDQAEQAATNAAQSATNAAQAAQAAAASQTAAGASAAAADQHKTHAEDAADRAEAASDLADEAVEQAQTAATAAGTAAQNASTAAQNASTAADGAIASAAAAETRINTLAASLPSDFTELNTEVNDLKSAVEINRISDAAITTGDYNYNVVFESGSYDTSGAKIANVKQLRSTNEFYFPTELCELTVPTGYRIFLYEVDPVTHEQIKSTTCQASNKRFITISKNVNIRIGGRKDANTEITAEELTAFNESFKLAIVTSPLKVKPITDTITDFNLLEPNTINVFGAGNADFTNGPVGFTEWKDGRVWLAISYEVNNGIYQLIKPIAENYSDTIYTRIYNAGNGTWATWAASTISAPVIHIGVGQKYTTIRAGFEAAYALNNATVYVHEGTYDLLTEFNDKITTHESNERVGNPLGHNMKVIFYEGAKVTALFDRQDYDSATQAWIDTYFNPFFAWVGDYSMESANIEASNCRYCVHDDRGETGIVRHTYKDCRMIFTKDTGSTFFSCIGGGLAEHTFIDIDGGYYQTINNEDPTIQAPIAYHNGELSTAQSQVFIKNVYLADNGYFDIAYHGNSTLQTNVYINGCAVGSQTIKRPAKNTDVIDNMTIIEWNTVVHS